MSFHSRNTVATVLVRLRERAPMRWSTVVSDMPMWPRGALPIPASPVAVDTQLRAPSVRNGSVSTPLRSLSIVGLVALAIGTAAAALYFARGLTLSHYDAKAHLVVARRILDSRQPGWQIGAVWLPLPHSLNVRPVQVDQLYRTGLSAVAFSVAGFVISAVSLWTLVAPDPLGAWAAFAVFAAHPDVLYLQATPMTEPLLMGLCLLAIALTWKWIAEPGARTAWAPGTVLAPASAMRDQARDVVQRGRPASITHLPSVPDALLAGVAPPLMSPRPTPDPDERTDAREPVSWPHDRDR